MSLKWCGSRRGSGFGGFTEALSSAFLLAVGLVFFSSAMLFDLSRLFFEIKEATSEAAFIVLLFVSPPNPFRSLLALAFFLAALIRLRILL